jgi:[ribosomal protein S5]-alanine N-acetyltransferase
MIADSIILSTERLLLKQVTPELLKVVYETCSDDEIKSFLGIDSDTDLVKEKAKYKKGLATFNRSFLYFYIIDKATAQNIGWCGYHTWYIEHNRAEIGYALNESWRQQGIMSEAIVPIIEYGFSVMNLNRIEAFVAPDGIASTKILKKLHFSQEGYLKAHYFANNKMEDSILFALLKDEYEASRHLSKL